MTKKLYIALLASIGVLLLLQLPVAAQTQPLSMTHGPNVEYVGPHSAEIAWTTSTGGSSIIKYGTNPSNLDQTAEEPYQTGTSGQHVTHRVTIRNLQPNTTYYYMVVSGQGQGTGTQAQSQVSSFKTKAANGQSGQGSSALQITNGPVVEYVGNKSAEIAWTTSTGGSSVIRYGTDPNNLNQTAEEPYQAGSGSQHVTHRVTIKNLQPNTTYYYIVQSGQGQGTGTGIQSSVSQFHTKS